MASQSAAFAGSFLPKLSVRSFATHQRFQCQQYRRSSSANTIVAAAPRRIPALARPLVPSETLLEFVEDTAQPRSTILKALSSYVKENKLQDPTNKRVVLCDDKLKKLFGVNSCTILEMSKYVSPHLSKPEAVGGKYIAEAEKFELDYISRKEREEREGATSGELKKKKRSRKGSGDAVSADKLAGRKLFKPLVLSPEMSAICGNEKEMTRQDIVKAIWEYIRVNNLRGAPGKPVRCDSLLKDVYGQDFIDVKAIMKGISPHVTKKEEL